MPNVSNLIAKTNFNAKITEREGKIPDVSNLITKKKLILRLLKQKVTCLMLLV